MLTHFFVLLSKPVSPDASAQVQRYANLSSSGERKQRVKFCEGEMGSGRSPQVPLVKSVKRFLGLLRTCIVRRSTHLKHHTQARLAEHMPGMPKPVHEKARAHGVEIKRSGVAVPNGQKGDGQ